MKNKLQSSYLLLLLIFSVLVSCKKGSNSTTQCRIIDIKPSDTLGFEMRLDYNFDNKLSVITYMPNEAKRTFSYRGNFIFISMIDGGTLVQELDTVSLNKNGLISTVERYVPSTKNFSYDTMNYDANNQLVNITENSMGHTDVSICTWNNGDLVSGSGPSFSGSNMEYYTDKKAADGDCLRINDLLLWGMPLVRCSHLLKSTINDTYSYTFDADGKITSMFHNGALMYSYTYACY